MTVTRHRLAAVAAVLTLAAPFAARAQDASQINLSADVPKKCMLGAVSDSVLDLGRLTGSDGRLDPAKTGTATSATTRITASWCNTPSVLKLAAAPLSLATTPSYATPTNFSRLITYNAGLAGWPNPITVRPLLAGGDGQTDADSAYAEDLTLTVSALNTLNSAGTAEATGQFVEAGLYQGSLTVTLTIAP